MSAIQAVLTQKTFVVATDTLVYKHFKDGSHVKCGYTSKFMHLPLFQTCAALLGYSRLKIDFYSFISEKVKATDIEGLVECTSEHLLDYLDLSKYRFSDQPGLGADEIGNIELFGFSRTLNKLVYYRLEVDRSKINVFKEVEITETERICIQHPRIGADRSQVLLEQSEDMVQESVDIMKEMYRQSLDPTTQTVLLGGEISVAVITSGPTFACTFFSAHEFEDYKDYIKNERWEQEVKQIIRKHNEDMEDLDRAFAYMTQDTPALIV